MKFFKPMPNNGKNSESKLTGANITQDSEDRLKAIKEKRKDRRDKLNEKTNNTNFADQNSFRKNKELSRKEYMQKERRSLSRLGLTKKEDEK